MKKKREPEEQRHGKEPQAAGLGGTRFTKPPGVASGAGGPTEERFTVVTYRNGGLSEETMTAKVILQLDPEEVDLQWDTVFGWNSILTRDGRRLRPFGRIPGAGPARGEPLLRRLMFSPGVLQDWRALTRDPQLADLQGNRRDARVTKIRSGLGEDGTHPWYILTVTSPYRIAWNPERSYRYIERLAEAAYKTALAG